MLKINNKTQQDNCPDSSKNGPELSCSGRKDIPIDRLLIWAYQEQKVAPLGVSADGLYAQEAEVSGIVKRSSSACGAATIAKIAEVGARIDRSSYVNNKVHADAEIVHEILYHSPLIERYARELMVVYARTGIAPDWLPEEKVELRAKMRANGKPEMIYEDAARRKPVACVLDIMADVEEIERAREVYSYFIEALNDLAALIEKDGGMTRYRPVKSQLISRPWAKKVVDGAAKT